MQDHQDTIEYESSRSRASRSHFSRTRLVRMHEVMRRHVGPGKIPGLITLVHLRGTTHTDCIGTMSFESSDKMKRDTLFRLASTTKPITAVAAMILIEECRLRLDDAVDNWLPELKNRKVLCKIDSDLNETVPAKRRITVRDLLTFRSGYGELGFIAPTSPLALAMIKAELPLATFPFPYSSDEFMKRLSDLPLAYHPGERWQYHMGLEILGVLISRVSGQSLGAFMQQRIFEPLGMLDTSFYVSKSKLNRLPICYGTDFPNTNLVILNEPGKDYVSRADTFESGAGGLVSTADDLMKFSVMMMNYGDYNGKRILSRPTVELMTTDQISAEQKLESRFFDNFWMSYSWGMGLGLVTSRSDIATSPGRFGWDGAFGTSLWIDPKEQLIGILLAQRRPDALGIAPSIQDFWTSVYQMIE